MADGKPVYTVETSNGNKDFTTENPHHHYNSIEEWLKAHKPFIDTLTSAAAIYGVIMTHHGKSTRLK